MRFTINIPNEYYTRIKETIKLKGFTTVNDFVLDLIRHKLEGDDLRKNDVIGGEKL